MNKKLWSSLAVATIGFTALISTSADSGLNGSNFSILASNGNSNSAIIGGITVDSDNNGGGDNGGGQPPASTDPVMKFTVGDASLSGCNLEGQAMYITGVTPGGTITSPSGATKPLVEGVNTIAETGQWTINGKFNSINDEANQASNVVNCITSVDEFKNTGVADLSYSFRYAVNITHFEELPPTVTNVAFMLGGATAMRQDISHWAVCDIFVSSDTFAGFRQGISYDIWPLEMMPPFGKYCSEL